MRGSFRPSAIKFLSLQICGKIQWLQENLGIIDDPQATGTEAIAAANSDGVYFVPAFQGLGAPYWDSYARGTIVGLTRGTGRAHVVRATLGVASETLDREPVTVIETNVDDMNPELVPALLEDLLHAGARDAFTTPVLAKKGRPAGRSCSHFAKASWTASALRSAARFSIRWTLPQSPSS